MISAGGERRTASGVGSWVVSGRRRAARGVAIAVFVLAVFTLIWGSPPQIVSRSLRASAVSIRAALYAADVASACGTIDLRLEEARNHSAASEGVIGRKTGRGGGGGGGDGPTGYVCLTFDDWYLETWVEDLVPLLEEYGATATFFLPTSHVASASQADLGYLEVLSGYGHELGHHSHSHGHGGDYVNGVSFRTRLTEYLIGEVQDGCSAFESMGLPRPVSFAYPYGSSVDVLDKAMAPHFVFLRGTHSAAVVREGLTSDDNDVASAISDLPVVGDMPELVPSAGLDEPVNEHVLMDVLDALASAGHQGEGGGEKAVVFFAHSSHPDARLHVDLNRLDRMLRYGTSLGLSFVSLSRLHSVREGEGAG